MSSTASDTTSSKPNKNEGRPRRITSSDPEAVEAAAAMGRRSSPAKTAAAKTNPVGNKSKTGQKASPETIAKLQAAWVVRKEKAAKKKAAASIAAAGTGNGETESA